MHLSRGKCVRESENTMLLDAPLLRRHSYKLIICYTRSRKQLPKPCTESLPSPCPTFPALFAVADDEACSFYTSGTRWAQRRGRRRSFRTVVSKICADMLFLRQQQQLFFFHWRCFLEMATTIRGQFSKNRSGSCAKH